MDKEVMITIAKERNRDLRDDYIHRRSFFKPSQMVFVDEAGDDRELAIPKKGYAPKGVTPVQVKPFHRGKRVSFFPAYTIDGVIYSQVYEGNTDLEVFESFLVISCHIVAGIQNHGRWSLWTTHHFTISPKRSKIYLPKLAC